MCCVCVCHSGSTVHGGHTPCGWWCVRVACHVAHAKWTSSSARGWGALWGRGGGKQPHLAHMMSWQPATIQQRNTNTNAALVPHRGNRQAAWALHSKQAGWPCHPALRNSLPPAATPQSPGGNTNRAGSRPVAGPLASRSSTATHVTDWGCNMQTFRVTPGCHVTQLLVTLFGPQARPAAQVQRPPSYVHLVRPMYSSMQHQPQQQPQCQRV